MPDRNKNDYLERIDPLGIIFNPTEEQIRRRQESLYLATHIDKVKRNYALYVYEQMQQQDPGFKERISKIPPPVDPCELIMEYIIFCGDFNNGFFVLFNPETNEPCVVEDAYDFLPGKTYTGCARQMLNYIVERRIEEESFLPFSSIKKVGFSAGQYKGWYEVDKFGKSLSDIGRRMHALGVHYSDTEQSRQRVNRMRGNKRAKEKAKDALKEKSRRYTQTSKVYDSGGKQIMKFAQKKMFGVFKPISPFSAFSNVTLTADTTTDSGNNQYLKLNIEKALTKYCDSNNNYNWLINQYYFE